jgi:prepilin-type N-terminal cleavage/methylation domain-containing protein
MSNRKGFTLIELLIVVVIIGILAAIAIPKFAATKEKAYFASMKSDLRNLATAQEGFFADNTTYMAGTAANAGAPSGLPTGCTVGGTGAGACLFVPSTGVTVIAALGAGGGWTATSTHAQVPGRPCAIAVGTAPIAPATVEGEPRCTP